MAERRAALVWSALPLLPRKGLRGMNQNYKKTRRVDSGS
jgi:hypothetical protein